MSSKPRNLHTSLRNAWGIRPGLRVWVGGHNLKAKLAAAKYLAETVRPLMGPIDLGLLTPASVDEAQYFADKLRSRLAPAGMIWIVIPRTSFPLETQSPSELADFIAAMLARGFVQIGEAALDDLYTSIGFRFDPGPSHK